MLKVIGQRHVQTTKERSYFEVSFFLIQPSVGSCGSLPTFQSSDKVHFKLSLLYFDVSVGDGKCLLCPFVNVTLTTVLKRNSHVFIL